MIEFLIRDATRTFFFFLLLIFTSDKLSRVKTKIPYDRFRSGGWSFGTQKFKDVSTTRYARQTYIYSAISYLRNRNFDGLDIDWEYPKGGDDKKNYVLLLKGKRNNTETINAILCTGIFHVFT